MYPPFHSTHTQKLQMPFTYVNVWELSEVHIQMLQYFRFMLICHRVNVRSQEVSFIRDFGNNFYHPTTHLVTFHAVLEVAYVAT